jgi:hypothetical protein
MFASILSAIIAIGSIIKVLYDVWKKTLMETDQDRIDKAKRQTDNEQSNFKNGNGGGDVEI